MLTIKYNIMILLIIIKLGTADDIPLQGSCKLKNYDTDGVCIKITSCPRAFQLLKLNDIESLRNMSCGFEQNEAKVCCPINSNDGHITFENTTAAAINGTEVILTSKSTTKQHTTTTIRITTMLAATTEATQSAINLVTHENRHQDSINKQKRPIKSPIKKHENSTSNILSLFNKTESNATFSSSVLPTRTECGLPTVADRIYGGTVTGLNEFPWLVRIKYKINGQEQYACAGSLITDRHIVTAAHCVDSRPITEVRLGEWDETTEKDCMNGMCNGPTVDIKISDSIIHPNYKQRNYEADIAILKLVDPVNYTDYIRPVCLPTTDYIINQDYMPDTTYISAGWGRTEYEFKSSIKRKISLPSVPMSVCRAVYSTIIKLIEPNIICAGGRADEDTCQGDSGGSLVRLVSEDYSPNYFLYGITSFGWKCGEVGKPSVYTRVAPYMKWILEIIKS